MKKLTHKQKRARFAKLRRAQKEQTKQYHSFRAWKRRWESHKPSGREDYKIEALAYLLRD